MYKCPSVPKIFEFIFFRKKISDWYEEAEKEVERDLSLDISQLENKVKTRKIRNKEAYEDVKLANSVNNSSKVMPNSTGPTVTLLRDFDPCFETTEEELDEASDGRGLY